MEIQASEALPATLVMRFHRATHMPVMLSKHFLEKFPANERKRYVEIAELNGGQLHDLIEDDPTIQPIFEAICQEAQQEIEAWHQQQILELEQRSPSIAELFRNGRGLCHRYWYTIQRLMWERYKIKWRSPAEMNPWITFD